MDAREAKLRAERTAESRMRASQLNQIGDVMSKLSPAPGYAAGNSADECGGAWQPPLSERIDRRLRHITQDAADLMRIQEILRAHPEFEQFIELQSLLNRRGL